MASPITGRAPGTLGLQRPMVSPLPPPHHTTWNLPEIQRTPRSSSSAQLATVNSGSLFIPHFLLCQFHSYVYFSRRFCCCSYVAQLSFRTRPVGYKATSYTLLLCLSLFFLLLSLILFLLPNCNLPEIKPSLNLRP